MRRAAKLIVGVIIPIQISIIVTLPALLKYGLIFFSKLRVIKKMIVNTNNRINPAHSSNVCN